MSEAVSTPIRLARHTVGIAAVAAINPTIYRVGDSATVWFFTWAIPLGVAALLFAFYALFFPKKARPAWPGSAIMLAWVLLVLLLVGSFQDKPVATDEWWKSDPPVQGHAPTNQSNAVVRLKPFTGKLDGE